ncbi:MAG: hybrid sensor histidine kinase/response regulator [Acidobacteria bacterium]|nr:MAG: hybrid sensor histidine kinase/response regulator [Acidobacteriota bacterium]
MSADPTFREAVLQGEEIELLLDAVQDYAIFLLSPVGQIQSWNRGAERTFGYEAPEILGKHFSTFYGPEDQAARKPQMELSVAESEGRIEDEGWRVRKDGARFWANTVITAWRDKTGVLRGFAKVTRDLTKHREAEERLRQSEEMFRLLVQSVKDYAIFMLDPGGNIATWNEGARRLKGYERDEIVGRHFSIFYPEADVRNGKPGWELEEAIKNGSVEDEGWRVRKNGTRFWANVVITAVFDEHRQLRGFAKVTRDFTERKEKEEAQRALMEQREARLAAEEEKRRAETGYRIAQEANRAKDEFLMTLSHELRTPMTAILGWTRLLPSLPPNEESFRDAVSSIMRGAQLQARLIDDVLDVSRIMSGKLRMSVENIDVAKLINASIEAVRPSADAKGIRITTELAAGLGAITGDPTRLQQVIWNLLTNAVKFTPRNGSVEVRSARTASHVEICVRDSGEGIEGHFLPHIFEPFRQAENPSTRVHGGLGLGLSIVRYLVEAHGGTVSAESEGRGKGATFIITLPVGAVRTAPKPGSLDVPADEMIEKSLRGLRILIVDDDREARQMIRAVLLQAGAEVIAVDTAQRALEELGMRTADVLVTDIAMPSMDGYALVREVREQKQHDQMKIAALSAFPSGRVNATSSGFDEFLSKPIDPFALVDAIARLASQAAPDGSGANS